MDEANSEQIALKQSDAIKDSLDTPFAYRNELQVPPQDTFSEKLHHVYMVPVRAELSNGHLAKYLQQMMQQQKITQEPLGIIVLLNNRQYDSSAVQTENAQTAQYLALLAQKNSTAIEAMPIPQIYKSLARELLKNELELRFDYITVTEDKHMGRLRDNLLGLAEHYKPEQVSADTMIVHFSDIDTVYRPKHTAQLNKVYTGDIKANIAKTDYDPGKYEDDTEEIQLTKEVIETFDAMRVWKIANRINSWINGGYQSVTPTYSGTLSFFKQEGIRKTLSAEARSDDYALGSLLRREDANAIAHEGEVYVVDRAKFPNSDPVLHLAHTDAESRYYFTKDKSATIAKIDTSEKISYQSLESEANMSFLLKELPNIRKDPEHYNWDTVVKQIAPSVYTKIRQDPASGEAFYKRLSQLVTEWPYKWSLPEEDGGGGNMYPYGSEDEMKYFISAYFLFHGFIMNKPQKNGDRDYYVIPDETENYIRHTESIIEERFTPPHALRDDADFQELLKNELRHEQAKVALRKSRLLKFIEEIKNEAPSPSQTSHAEFFRTYYPEIEAQIRTAVGQHVPDSAIAQTVTNQFADFFLPDAPVHMNIAHLKAIEEFLKKKNIRILQDDRDYKYM